MDLDPTEIALGVNPNTACKIEVKVRSFVTVDDGKEVHHRATLLQWPVDTEEYSPLDLENDIPLDYRAGKGQEMIFWYSGKDDQIVRLSTDAELLSFLRASSKISGTPRFIMTVGQCDQVSPENLVVNTRQGFSSNERVDNIVEWADVPQFGETVAGPPRVEEVEKEHCMIVGDDPEGDEPAGADEEWRYYKKSKGTNDEQVGKNIGNELVVRLQGNKTQSIKSNTVNFDPDSVPDDEAVVLDEILVMV